MDRMNKQYKILKLANQEKIIISFLNKLVIKIYILYRDYT